MASSNKKLIPEAKKGLDRLKNEVASEVGMKDYEHRDKGELSSRQNGSIGGEMVRRMVQSYQEGLINR